MPTQGKHAVKQKTIVNEIISKYELTYNAEFIVGGRSMHHVMEITFIPNDAASMAKAGSCYLELIDELAQNGYGLYRTSIAFMDEVADTYGPVMKSVRKKIKQALDPNAILSPGKSGI